MAAGPVGPNRSRTRGLVLDLIRGGTGSRAELVAATGLTAATISEVVRELMHEDLVVEAGRGTSTGGKRPRLLTINPAARYGVGVQLERHTCVIVLVDLAGRRVARVAFDGVRSMAPTEGLALVAAHISAMLEAEGIERAKVLGVGLVSYGPQQREAGVLLTPQPTHDWYGYPVADRLAEDVGLPVLLDNDAAAAAIGEYWLGAVGAGSAYGCIYMATGIGGGVVVSGDVYRGSSSNSVEVGHISIDLEGEECTCGNVGCLENEAGPPAVLRQAAAVPGLRQRLALDPAGDNVLTEFAKLSRAAVDGDAQARELVERQARRIGHAAVTMTVLFDLDTVVLAGPSFAVGSGMYQAIVQQEIDRRTFARHAHPVRVIPSVSGSDAAAIGGAVLVLQSQLTAGT